MPKELIEINDVEGVKNPLGVKESLDTVFLVRLRLISETKILFELYSGQKSRLLKIYICDLLVKLSLKTLIFPRI
jgi:hypothetical protein